MRRDLHHWIVPSVNISIAVQDTDPAVGAIVDTQGYSILEYIIISEVISTGTFTPSLEWGNEPDLSDAVAVDAAHILGSIADATFVAAEDITAKSIGVYLTTYRYVRLTITGTNTPNGTIGAVAVLGGPYAMPTQS